MDPTHHHHSGDIPFFNFYVLHIINISHIAGNLGLTLLIREYHSHGLETEGEVVEEP